MQVLARTVPHSVAYQLAQLTLMLSTVGSDLYRLQRQSMWQVSSLRAECHGLSPDAVQSGEDLVCPALHIVIISITTTLLEISQKAGSRKMTLQLTTLSSSLHHHK